jgi:hypothetical protein
MNHSSDFGLIPWPAKTKNQWMFAAAKVSCISRINARSSMVANHFAYKDWTVTQQDSPPGQPPSQIEAWNRGGAAPKSAFPHEAFVLVTGGGANSGPAE